MQKLLEKWHSREIYDDKRYRGEIVDLKERNRISKESAIDGVATIFYDIYLSKTNIKVGKCDFRLKNDDFMYYYGNVGYRIYERYRGHHYAYYACKVLFEIAKRELNYKEILVTCNPDNVASYKTLKRLNGILIDTCRVPCNHDLYAKGDRYKCVFKFVL